MNKDTFWKNKVDKVCELSEKYNYPYDKEFWMRQVAGVISLIIDIAESKSCKGKCKCSQKS